MKTKFMEGVKRAVAVRLGLFLAGLVCWNGGGRCEAQPAATPLAPGVVDAINLTKAGISDDVIVAQVRSTGVAYKLSADQIIYLNKQGVSQNVIKALITGGNPAAATATTAGATNVTWANIGPTNAAVMAPATGGMGSADDYPEVATQPLTYEYVRDQLAPYGFWFAVAGYGWCWRPAVSGPDPDWRPYGQEGDWIFTDAGWCWQSRYPWGDIVFHYGRWFRDSLSWIWVPGYQWAPAWVCWREADGFFGWAPLPPEAAFDAGAGLEYRGRPAVDVDFGVSADAYSFVPYDHFWDQDLTPFIVPRNQVIIVFRNSVMRNGFRTDRGRIFVEGPGRERVAALTHREVREDQPVFRDPRVRSQAEATLRVLRIERLNAGARGGNPGINRGAADPSRPKSGQQPSK